MSENGEECELQHLVPADDIDRDAELSKGEATPPVTPLTSKVTQTSPTTPISGKMSSSSHRTSQGGSSIKAAKGGSSGTTPVPPQTKVAFVNEKGARQAVPLEQTFFGRKPTSIARPHRQKKVLGTSRIPCPHHSFLSDATDVRRMETALLQLLEDFHSGKLRAFGKDCSMEEMERIREQQERLARLHFDLGAQQELYHPLSEEGLRATTDNMRRLMASLQQLSVSIERLHSVSNGSNGGVPEEKSSLKVPS